MYKVKEKYISQAVVVYMPDKSVIVLNEATQEELELAYKAGNKEFIQYKKPNMPDKSVIELTEATNMPDKSVIELTEKTQEELELELAYKSGDKEFIQYEKQKDKK